MEQKLPEPAWQYELKPTATYHRGQKIIGVGAAGLLILSLGACGASSTATDTSQTVSTATEVAAGKLGLSAGSVTVTVGDTEVTYNAAYLVDGIDATISGGTYEAAEADEAVFVVVNGGSLTVSDATITKSGDAASNDSESSDDVSDEYNFYGANSAIVVVGEGSSATVDGSTITSDSSGSNAVVAVDSGEATVSNTTIETSGNSSRGLHATYGGAITASDMTITTQDAHSAAVATDRGGGSVDVTGTNVFNTNGDGSPLIYSTGAITVDGLSGTSAQSQVIVVEGKNSATLSNADVTSGGGNALMIYQSMSGDAADEDAADSLGSAAIWDSSITYTGDGPVFYFTNTTADLDLSNVTVDSSSGALAIADEGRWGTEGSNGADVTWSVAGSELSGSVTAGDSSAIEVALGSDGAIDGETSGDVSIG
ncbi:MAG: hypothetical protein L0K34_07625 [Ancrocorticia sp.]|nr:hypothetical protein [Ancrocorticia sp.]